MMLLNLLSKYFFFPMKKKIANSRLFICATKFIHDYTDNFHSTHFFMFFMLFYTRIALNHWRKLLSGNNNNFIFILNENNLFCAYCGRYFYERMREKSQRTETIVFNYMRKKTTHLDDDIIFFSRQRRRVRNKEDFC